MRVISSLPYRSLTVAAPIGTPIPVAIRLSHLLVYKGVGIAPFHMKFRIRFLPSAVKISDQRRKALYDCAAMIIAVDEVIPYGREAFGALGEVRSFSGRKISAADLREAEALVVRSVTQV